MSARNKNNINNAKVRSREENTAEEQPNKKQKLVQSDRERKTKQSFWSQYCRYLMK